MTDLIVKRTDVLNGTVAAPSSKAHTHRAFIASFLSDGKSTVKDPLICDDTLTTINACRMLGARIKKVDDDIFEVDGLSKPVTPEDVIDCRESGSTIRFLTPVCALADGISVLSGGESLRRRPMKPLLEALRGLGVECYSTRRDGCPPVVIFGGGIKGGRTFIRGDVSSQFISGLLFATPKASTETEITLTTRLESKPYVKITLEILKKHGVKVDFEGGYRRFFVPPKQEYAPFNHVIERDYSSAAFLLVAASITDSRVRVRGLKKETHQGDRIIVDILKEAGSTVKVGEDYIEVKGDPETLKGIDLDLRDNPDLVPICAVLACSAKGRTRITGVRRLRLKESDRIASLSAELKRMGAEIKTLEDTIIIEGVKKLHGAEMNSHRDHRIAMACAVAALKAEGSSVIHGAECISKSYPNFVRDLSLIGGNVFER